MGAEGEQIVANKVGQIVSGAKDGRGETVDYVYFKRDDYAIYRSKDQIVVAYSDTKATADQQIAVISPLLPLRDHLINLLRELPANSPKDNYLAQIADALRLGLEKQAEIAKAILGEAVQTALDRQARIGRMIYLKSASGIAMVIAFVLIPIGGAYVPYRKGVHLLLMATGAGAVGALLSIAIAIRSRSVAIDGNWRANAMDASVRVLIGVISATVLFLLLTSGFLTDVQAGSVKFTAGVQWQAALLVGFVAGFLERLVPDLLEKSVPTSRDAARTPTSSGGVATPGGAGSGG